MSTESQLRGDSVPASGLTRGSLIFRARDRDPGAWQELVDLYGPLVAHWCRRCGLDCHASADCVQEVFTAISRSLPAYEPVRASGAFRSWIWTITANKIRDYLRRNRRQPQAAGGTTAYQQLAELADVPDTEPTSAADVRQLVARSMEQIRGEFEPRTWAVFQRSVVDQIATAIVAGEFEIQPAAVRQIRSRILRRLRQQLGDVD